LFEHSQAQDNCTDVLYKANSFLKSGNFVGCISLLETCVEALAGEDQFEARKMLAISYTELKNSEKANEQFFLMLQQKPDYQRYPNSDPLAVQNGLKQFTVYPRFAVGIETGINRNMPQLLKSYSTLFLNQGYLPKYGFQISQITDFKFNPLQSISLGIGWMGSTQWLEISNEDVSTTIAVERFKFFQTSLTFRQHFELASNLQGYVGIGAGYNRLTDGQLYLEWEAIQTRSTSQYTKSVRSERSLNQFYWQPALGIKYALETGIIGLELFGQYYSQAMALDNKRYSDLDFILNTQYVSDDVKLKLQGLKVSYSFPIQHRIIEKH
jgi:hypothetical protein